MTIRRPGPRDAQRVLVLFAAVFLCVIGPARAASELDPSLFPLPTELEPNVAFWSDVYGRYDSTQALLHDDRYLQVVYEVLDFADLEGLPETRKRLLRRERIREAEERWSAVLSDLAAGNGGEALARERTRLAALFADVPGGREKYRAAIDRMRVQTCLRDRFAEGIERSGLFMPTIEEIFERRGLPRALTRLPFVESLFQVRAHSSAAAAGIWQFVRSTGRRYLRIDREIDERFDFVRASEAAATYLAANYRDLGTWPLALTAYNHGEGGMRRAVRTLGTRDIGTIVEHYKGRTFGFASRNFYSEFIAANLTYESRADRFPGVEPQPRLSWDVFTPDRYVSLPDLARATGTEPAVLEVFNPAFVRDVWRGDLLAPPRYPVRVPAGRGAAFATAYGQLGPASVADRQLGTTYRVRPGDTLSAVARKFGTTVQAIQHSNNLRSAHRIHTGQTLLIPPGRSHRSGSQPRKPTRTPTPQASPTPEGDRSYAVQSGDTLSTIARRHGSTVTVLRLANGLRSDRIVAGQRLRIPAARRAHVVRGGESLGSIARRYGTDVSTLKHLNRLGGDVIHPRQLLLIP